MTDPPVDDEIEQGNADSGSEDREDLHICADCKHWLHRSCYSKTQWSKVPGMGRCKSCTGQATEFGTTGVDGSWQDYRKNHHSAHRYKGGATAVDVAIMWLVRIDPMRKRLHDNLVTDRAYVEGVDDDYKMENWY
jgi:hypothetical protein